MLRGINVSGQKKIRMVELKSLYEGLGLEHVRTYLQSGNVIFDSPEADASKLSRIIEAQIEGFFGYSVAVFIRESQDFKRILEENPFTGRGGAEPNRMLVTFLYQPPSAQKLGELTRPAGTSDEFSAGEKEIFLFCPDGYGRSKLSNNFFERKLDMPATTRNWKTVNALYELASKPSGTNS